MPNPTWQEILAATTGAAQGHATPPDPDDVNWPIGSVFVSVVPDNPASLIGVGTWESFGAGKVLVGLDAGNPLFDTVEKTGGALEVTSAGSNTAPTISGNTASEASHTHSVTSNVSVNDHASHTHTYTEVVQHTHAVNVTDGGHTHVQNAHTHTQNAHGHNVAPTSATTGSVTVTQAVFAADTSGTVGTGVASANIVSATAVNQNATAVNQSATTGITATTSNPAGSGASGTTNGPSATLTHTANNPAVTSGAGSSHSHGVGTLQADAPTFTGQATSVVQPYIVCYFWKRVA